MAGISSKATGGLENKYKYNDGSELNTDFDLSWYETHFRGYDPQTGRFTQVDPYADDFESFTPYNYTENNPILFNDPLGLSKSGAGFPDDKEADASLANVTVRPSVKNMNASQMDAFWARNSHWENGQRTLGDISKFDGRTQNFLQDYNGMQTRGDAFNKVYGDVVYEAAMFAVPWGRVLKGVGWVYRAAKARQAAKLLRLAGYGADEAIAANLSSIIPKKGWYDVVIHGSKDGMNFILKNADATVNNIVSPAELYSKMLADGYTQGTRVRLLSCFSGSLGNGSAAQLSQLTEAMVVAPKSWMYVADGTSMLAAPGKFVTGKGMSAFSVFK